MMCDIVKKFQTIVCQDKFGIIMNGKKIIFRAQTLLSLHHDSPLLGLEY